MINFQDPSMFAAARAHVSSWRWRLGVGALFALGASFVLDNFAAGFGWFLAVTLSTGFDAMLGHSYLETRGRERKTTGMLFLWGCAFTIAVFSAMTLYLAYAGGGPGRILSALMAASALVSVMLFLFQAPAFMAITAAPAMLCLLGMSFIPFSAGPAAPLEGGMGVAAGAAGFLAYMLRAALYNGRMMKGLREATKEAKDRASEAEVKREEAEAANRAKSDFLTVMTHELRTPLNAVIGYAEIVGEDLQADGLRADLVEDTQRITGSARHLLGLIDQILHMTSIDAGHDGLALRDVNVRALINDAVHGVDAQANGNRIAVRVAGDAEFAHTDGAKVGACLAALLSNATKFTTNGLIAVTAEREIDVMDHEWLVVSVSDTGCGIAKASLTKIFQPFTQGDESTTRATGGMGLGLAVAQRAARVLGGDVTVKSEVGTGSTFTLRVPKRMEAAKPQAVAAAA